MNRRLASPDHSLNAPLRSDSEGEWQDWLVDESESQETMLGERQELGLRRDLLEKAMTHLNDRERHILTERRLKENPTTLEDLSQQYGISRERVRQIEVRAFEKVAKAVRHRVAAIADQPVLLAHAAPAFAHMRSRADGVRHASPLREACSGLPNAVS
jgi:RNA polymerase sigma-32 factor